jgi:hypothetical protein
MELYRLFDWIDARFNRDDDGLNRRLLAIQWEYRNHIASRRIEANSTRHLIARAAGNLQLTVAKVNWFSTVAYPIHWLLCWVILTVLIACLIFDITLPVPTREAFRQISNRVSTIFFRRSVAFLCGKALRRKHTRDVIPANHPEVIAAADFGRPLVLGRRS